MITVEEASSIIQSNLYVPKVISVSLDQCLGMTLAEPIIADRDFPPFDRVTMDGVALASDTFFNGQRSYKIDAVQLAGMPQLKLDNADNCIEVMTGAMLPLGTDVVIKYEELTIENGIAEINSEQLKPSQNVHLKGSDEVVDNILIDKGTKISTAEIGVIATVGKETVKVLKSPVAAIISTGDELVNISETPMDYQIRQSNSHVLKAALAELGVEATIFHIMDDKVSIHSEIKKILSEYELVILSGGVSKGKKDYIPAVLEELGVEKLFHGVKQRPGKPFWFGRSQAGKAVFALPGNPVSTYMCFYRYVKPWINSSMGGADKPSFAVLGTDFSFEPQLTYFLQVKIENVNGTLTARPIQGKGSGDLANLISADGFMELPADQSFFQMGTVFPIIRYRSL